MPLRPFRPLLVLAGAAALAGCAQVRSHQGYIIDADLMNSVQTGVDNRQSVLQTLGKPSFASQFNEGDWYYISRDSRNYAFNNPRARSQIAVRISFDPAGTVTGVSRGDLDQVAKVDMYGKTTPTLGKKRNLFDEIFGNIGTVGALGGAGGGGGATSRDEP